MIEAANVARSSAVGYTASMLPTYTVDRGTDSSSTHSGSTMRSRRSVKPKQPNGSRQTGAGARVPGAQAGAGADQRGHAFTCSEEVVRRVVVPEEELLQRGRLADQAAHAGVAQHPDDFGQALAVDLGAQGMAFDADVFDAGDPAEIDGVADHLGLDRSAGQVTHRFQRAALDGTARPDDRDPVAQRLGLGEDVAGQQDRHAAVAGLADALLEHVLHQRIQAAARFVEQQQSGIRRERRDQRHLLPIALGVGARLLGRIEVEPLDQLGAPLLVDAAAHPGQQVDRLPTGQRRPQRDIAGHIGHLAVQRDGVGPRVAAEQSHRSRVGARQAEQDADRRRLTRAVGPEEAVHLAIGDGQVEAVKGAHRAEVLRQPPDLDGSGRVLGHHGLLLWR